MIGLMKLTRKRVFLLVLAVVVLCAGVWSARRLKEQWYAIPARGGESFTAPVLKTAHYRQHDPRWAEEKIGGFGESMGPVGCTICSLAMALDYYDVKMTPKELNEFLKANEGYNARGWLRWNAVEKVSGGKVVVEYLGRPSPAVMDQALKNRQPVVAKVYINTVIPHWVLVAGKDGQEYVMRDPLGEADTLGRLSDYSSKLYAVRVLKKL